VIEKPRAMQSLLFNVSPFDPLTLGAAAALLVLVALVACYLPARRAAQVDSDGCPAARITSIRQTFAI